MSYQPHYIASYDQDSGLFKYTEPFLAPEKAFPELENAYCWRSKVRKKLGVTLLGRLRRVISDTLKAKVSSATTVYNLFSGLTTPITQTYAQIEPIPSSNPLTITIAAPISQVLTDTLGTGVLTIAPAGLITSATIDYNTGDLTLIFSGAAGASTATIDMAYFPGLPVMGCRTRELPANNAEETIFFDMTYAYVYNPATKAFNELPTVPPLTTTWHGLNSDLFWTTNYASDAKGALFWASNNNMGSGTRDPLRYFNGTLWTDFTPPVDLVNSVYNARIILPYKDRLVLLNTWEGTTAGTITLATNLPQRARWSWNGDPLHVDGGGIIDAWRSDTPGYGGYVDAPTAEQIVGAEFIKDTLIVKFERSSWKLVYTGNEVLPFIFQKINTELGSESTFSLVPFDRGVFSVGNVGITTDDSVNVERIDTSIPDIVFEFNNDNEGVQRVYGIRDYPNELVYWTYPYFSENPIFPNKVLCYNYRNNTYAQFTDSFTCYGYWQRGQDLAWFQLPYASWAGWPGFWNSGAAQSLFPAVVAGNQQGFVEIVQSQGQNDISLFLDAIDIVNAVYVSPDHNLQSGDIIEFSGVIGTLGTLLNGNRFTVSVPTTNPPGHLIKDTFTINDITGTAVPPSGTYLGGGVIARIDNFLIATKVFAPFYEQGAQCRLGYIDYLLSYTEEGEISSQVYIDENSAFSMNDSNVNTALLGSDVIYTRPENLSLIPFQATQDKIWHRQFVQTVSQNFQVQLMMSQDQMFDPLVTESAVIMHAMAFYLSPNARLTQ